MEAVHAKAQEKNMRRKVRSRTKINLGVREIKRRIHVKIYSIL